MENCSADIGIRVFCSCFINIYFVDVDRLIINDLLGKLYRYDYRFGYNLLLDEENSIEKKLHTPVREEWEAEDDEI